MLSLRKALLCTYLAQLNGSRGQMTVGGLVHTSYRVDSNASCVLQTALKPMCWLAEGLQEEVVQHWREVRRDLHCVPFP